MGSQLSRVLHYTAKVVLILPTKFSYDVQFQILYMFSHFGFIDVAIVSAVADGIEVSVLKKLGDSMAVYKNVHNIPLIFPDKLKNLSGYRYKIVIHRQSPRVIIKNRTVISPMAHFLVTIAKVQSTSFNFVVIKDYKDLASFWDSRQMDLTLNAGVAYPDAPYPKLITYEETGYCALVPKPPKISISEIIYVKPFDMYTWMLLVITIACCGVVWKLFGSRGAVDSHWLLVYGIFVMFIGQGVEFSRRNRMVLAILLQLIIFMIFVLSSAYEGVITSFMIQPAHENLFTRFDQILASKYEIITDEAFAWTIKDSEEFMAIKLRINTSAVQMGSRYIDEILRQKMVFVRKCDVAETDIKTRIIKDKTMADFYYLLPERIINYYVRLEASYFNPFIERLQYYMDLSFQAGLPHMWRIYAAESVLDSAKRQLTPASDILKLMDLAQVFYIVLVGYAAALAIFLIEIFFHNVLRNLKLAHLARQLGKRVNRLAYKKRVSRNPKYQRGALYYIINQHKKVKRLRKLKVRRIYVQPVNSGNQI